MIKTSLTILFGRNGLTAKADFTIEAISGGEQILAPATDLLNENSQKAYATYEPDYWLLDGNYKFIAEEATIGYISESLSNASGDFFPVAPPELELTFGSVYSTVAGLTLYFASETNDYCDDLTISYYDSGASLIRSDSYNPTGPVFATGQAVSNFKSIKIEFGGTNKAYRFARLINIDIDTVTRWTGSNIKSGKLTEQINPLSLEIPSNEIEFTLFSSDPDFSITNPANEYAALQENEPIEAYEQVGDNNIFLGRFYLDEWKSISENEARFVAFDAISLMDGKPFLCPKNSISTPEQFFAAVFSAAGIDYELDSNFDVNYSESLVWDIYAGLLPIMTCREALQQVLFILGAYASCARSSVVKILPMELASSLVAYDFTLTAANKSISSPVETKRIVTAVELFSYAYSRIYYDVGGSGNDIFDGSLAVGSHILTFQDYFPIFNTTITGTASLTITDEGRNWVILNVTGAGTVIITQPYFFKQRNNKTIIENGSLPAGTKTNVISIRDGHMVFPSIADETAQRVYDYHLQRYIQKTKVFGSIISAGDTVLIDTQSSQQIKGIVERAEFNLTGGFIANLEIVGVIA